MDFLTGVFAWVTGHLPQLLEIIGAFAIIATLTPNKTDDKIVQTILNAVNFLGANMGKAKNSE